MKDGVRISLGKGSIRNQPSEFLQNDFVHDSLYGIPEVPVGKKRREIDFTVAGSITRWGEFMGQRRVLFLSGGGQTGKFVSRSVRPWRLPQMVADKTLDIIMERSMARWQKVSGLSGFPEW